MKMDDMISLRTKQRENLDRFQAWMRESKVEWAKAHMQPQSDIVGLEMNGDVRTLRSIESRMLNQTTFNASYDESAEEDVPVVSAFREIIRFSVSHDEMLRDLAIGSGVTIMIPCSGFMTIETPVPIVRDSDILLH